MLRSSSISLKKLSYRTESINVKDKLFNKTISAHSKYALLLELQNNIPIILFPDRKSSIKFSFNEKTETIQTFLDKFKSNHDHDSTFGCYFASFDNIPFANSCQAKDLLLLPRFKIIFDNGEKQYDCLNVNYLGNTCIDKSIDDLDNEYDIDKVNRLVIEEEYKFTDALEYSKLSLKKGSSDEHSHGISYRDILKSIYNNKYLLIDDLVYSKRLLRNQKYSRLFNLFFYLASIQVLSINVFTFILLNWDIMEPVTQCLTFGNIIFGYYFWAFTKTSFDPPCLSEYFSKDKKFLRKEYNQMIEEKELVYKLLVKDRNMLI